MNISWLVASPRRAPAASAGPPARGLHAARCVLGERRRRPSPRERDVGATAVRGGQHPAATGSSPAWQALQARSRPRRRGGYRPRRLLWARVGPPRAASPRAAPARGAASHRSASRPLDATLTSIPTARPPCHDGGVRRRARPSRPLPAGDGRRRPVFSRARTLRGGGGANSCAPRRGGDRPDPARRRAQVCSSSAATSCACSSRRPRRGVPRPRRCSALPASHTVCVQCQRPQHVSGPTTAAEHINSASFAVDPPSPARRTPAWRPARRVGRAAAASLPPNCAPGATSCPIAGAGRPRRARGGREGAMRRTGRGAM